jgi:hypothetical protein
VGESHILLPACFFHDPDLLEKQLQRKLHLPGNITLPRDLPKVVLKIFVRRRKQHVVGDVKGFGAELQRESFTEAKVLEQGKIQVVDSRPPDGRQNTGKVPKGESIRL